VDVGLIVTLYKMPFVENYCFFLLSVYTDLQKIFKLECYHLLSV